MQRDDDFRRDRPHALLQGYHYARKQISEIRVLKWDYLGEKKRNFRYVNPIAGLGFSLTQKYYFCDGCKFEFPKHLTSISYRSRFYYDVYEWEERQLVRTYIKPNDRVLELGACIGVVSCVINRQLSDGDSTHVAVEPNSDLIKFIERNRELNNCEFLIEQCVISNRPESDFHKNEDITNGSMQLSVGAKIAVPGKRIADLERSYGQFNVLVADIQGGEADLLALEESSLCRFRLIIIEMHPHIIGEKSVQTCRERLHRLGFVMRERLSTVEAWMNSATA